MFSYDGSFKMCLVTMRVFNVFSMCLVTTEVFKCVWLRWEVLNVFGYDGSF